MLPSKKLIYIIIYILYNKIYIIYIKICNLKNNLRKYSIIIRNKSYKVILVIGIRKQRGFDRMNQDITLSTCF